MVYHGWRSLLVLCVLSTFMTACAPAQRSNTYFFRSQSEKHKGYLGVSTDDVTPRLAERKHLKETSGAYVTDVTEDSPAEAAGIESGDVILRLDSDKIEGGDDLLREVRKRKPGTEVKVEIERRGEKKTLTAKLDRVPLSYAYSFDLDDDMPRMRLPRVPRTPMPRMEMHLFHDRSLDGLELQDMTRQLAEYFEAPGNRGVLVTDVSKGSDGEKAGFKAGDVISKVDNAAVRDVDDVYREIEDDGKSKEVDFGIVRKGKGMILKMKVGGDRDEDEDEDDMSFRMFHRGVPGGDRAGLFSHSSAAYRELQRLHERLDGLKSSIGRRIGEITGKITGRIKERFREITAELSTSACGPRAEG